MKFIKKLFRFLAADGNDKQRESFSLPTNQTNKKSGELTQKQLAEILDWLSLY